GGGGATGPFKVAEGGRSPACIRTVVQPAARPVAGRTHLCLFAPGRLGERISERTWSVSTISLRKTESKAVDRHPDPAQSLEDLLNRALAADWEAWRDLERPYAHLLVHTAGGVGLNHSEAADVAQLTWLRLWQHGHQIREPERLPSRLGAPPSREGSRVALRCDGCRPGWPPPLAARDCGWRSAASATSCTPTRPARTARASGLPSTTPTPSTATTSPRWNRRWPGCPGATRR